MLAGQADNPGDIGRYQPSDREIYASRREGGGRTYQLAKGRGHRWRRRRHRTGLWTPMRRQRGSSVWDHCPRQGTIPRSERQRPGISSGPVWQPGPRALVRGSRRAWRPGRASRRPTGPGTGHHIHPRHPRWSHCGAHGGHAVPRAWLLGTWARHSHWLRELRRP